MVKVDSVELPVQALNGYAAPVITSLHAQRDGSVLCGLMFSAPALWKIKPTLDVEDLKLETELGAGVVGITGGLRATTSGDTAFAVLHEGFAPGFLRKLAGGDLRGRSGAEVANLLVETDGGLGVSIRHSVVQMTDGKIVVRRYREPGALLDAAHIGDFVFGLYGGGIWREPYLNTEKREVLRKDLGTNGAIHRDAVGNIWMASRNGRLLRLGQTDIKAKPTPLKIPGGAPNLSCTASSVVDEWLYGVSDDGKALFRFRVNPVSAEDEIQTVAELDRRILAVGCLGTEAEIVAANPVGQVTPVEGVKPVPHSTLVVAVEGAEGVELWTGLHLVSDDPELMAPLPKLVQRTVLKGAKTVSTLSSFDGKTLWAGEGRLNEAPVGNGGAKPRIFRISGLSET